MHTVIVIASGLLLLGFMLLTGNWAGMGMAKGALLFIPIWFALSLTNLWLGVSRAGYSVSEEVPVLLVVFGVPAALGFVAWWFFSRSV